MAEGFNRVMLLGNLGADPELRQTQGGPVLTLRIATTESYLDKDKVRHKRTDWHNVVVWGKRGEALSKWLAKGRMVFVEGSLRTSSYDDRDGTKRYKTEVVAQNVIPADTRREGAHGGAADGPAEGFGGDDGAGPYPGFAEDQAASRTRASGPALGQGGKRGGDDIPF